MSPIYRDCSTFHHVVHSSTEKNLYYGIYDLHFVRAVFKWLSKNQNQSNYSDQSRQGQTARWTNHNS